MATHIVLMLWSSTTGDAIQQQNQTRLENLLIGKKIAYKKIDGSDVDLKEKRDESFGISTVRANYPQCFLENTSDGKIAFVGLWDVVESLVECNDLPADVIASNPDIKTFDNVFKCAKEQPL